MTDEWGAAKRRAIARALNTFWDSGDGDGDDPVAPLGVSGGARLLAQAGISRMAAAGDSDRYIIPDRIKEVGPVIDRHHLKSFLEAISNRSDEARTALRLFEAMQSVGDFEREFMVDPGSLPPLRRTRSRLPPSIFAAAEAAGILLRLPHRTRPSIAAPMKAVADRKAAGVGRLIYPACRLNEGCRAPDRCPLPLLPDLVSRVSCRNFGWTCDLRSWFYSFTMSEEVAAKYFATYDSRGRAYAHVRGPMGFSHMPTLATCVAQAMICDAIGDLPAYGVAWIDDVTVVADDEHVAETVRQRFQDLARRLNVEIRDMTTVSRHIAAVGIDFDLEQHAWRLLPSWCEKALVGADTGRASDSVRQVLKDAGRVAWSVYALQIPYFPFIALLREAGAVADQLVEGMLDPNSVHIYSVDAADALQKGVALIRANPWRCLAPAPTAAVVSDASNIGLGMLVVDDLGHEREVSVPVRMTDDGTSPRHICVMEAAALRLAVCRPAYAGRTVHCVVDNSTLFWLLLTNRAARNSSMGKELVKLLRWCYEHGTTLVPLWMGTANMADVGADEASRYPHARSRIIRAGTIAECIRRGIGDTRTLMGGLDATRKGAAYVLPNSLTALLFYPQ